MTSTTTNELGRTGEIIVAAFFVTSRAKKKMWIAGTPGRGCGTTNQHAELTALNPKLMTYTTYNAHTTPDSPYEDQERLYEGMNDREVILHLAEMTDLSCSEVEQYWHKISAWYTPECIGDRLHQDIEYVYPDRPGIFERWLIYAWTGDPADMTIAQIFEELFPFVDSTYRDYLIRGALYEKMEDLLIRAGYTKVPTGDNLDWRWV